jgi:hypothetical protein
MKNLNMVEYELIKFKTHPMEFDEISSNMIRTGQKNSSKEPY